MTGALTPREVLGGSSGASAQAVPPEAFRGARKPAPPVLTAAGEVCISEHAVLRYIERVKPGFHFKQAHRELAMLLPFAEVCDPIPDWAVWIRPADEQPTDSFLVACDSLVFPVAGGWVKTTLTRGTFPPTVRAARSNAHKRRRKLVHLRERNERSAPRRRARKGKKDRPHFGAEEAA